MPTRTRSRTGGVNKYTSKYYAVAVGRHTGIFQTWAEAHKSTQRYPKACHKAFETLQEAQHFLETYGHESANDNVVLLDSTPEVIVTDLLNDIVSEIIDDNSEIIVDNAASADIPDNNVNNDVNTNLDDSSICDSAQHNCIVCDNVDHMYMLKCDHCASWLHFECTQLPAYQLTFLRNSKQQFACSNCVTLDPDIDIHLQDQHTAKPSSSVHIQTDPTPTSSVEHSSCLAAIRHLETSLVDRLVQAEQDCYNAKLLLIKADMENLKKENAQLKTQVEKLQRSPKTTESFNDKVHKLRQDMESTFKDRQGQWKITTDDLKKQVDLCIKHAKKNDELLLEKEKQITGLQQKLSDTELDLKLAQSETYEAKRTQLAMAVDTTDFKPVKFPAAKKSSASNVRNASVGGISHCDSSNAHTHKLVTNASVASPRAPSPVPSTHTLVPPMNLVSTPPASYAAVVRSTPNSSKQHIRRQDGHHSRPNMQDRQQHSRQQDNGQTRSTRDNYPSSVPAPRVLIIGNSHIHGIDKERLIPRARVAKLMAFTMEEVEDHLKYLTDPPECVVIHVITNDIKKHGNPQVCAEYLYSMVDYYATKFPGTNFVISLGLPRLDDLTLNMKTEIVNALLKDLISRSSANVQFCDNSNFVRNGIPQRHLLAIDRYHLSPDGTRLLASNLRCKVELTLNMRHRRSRNSAH